MKAKLLLASCALSFVSYAQIYTPSGSITGSSGSNSVGIGTSSPGAKVDVYTNSSLGALHLRTTNSQGLGGVYFDSPYAISLDFSVTRQHNSDTT